MNRTLEITKNWQKYHQLTVKINDLKILQRKMYPKKAVFCQTCYNLAEWKPVSNGKSECCNARLIGLTEAVEALELCKTCTLDRIAELYGGEEI